MTNDLPVGGVATRAHRIKVLVVDDSQLAREMLTDLLNADPRLVVVGTVGDGLEAVKAARALCPDVITMDIQMPRLDGFAASRKIMETCPTRIIMVTASIDPRDVAATFRALEAGALTVMAKPGRIGHPDFALEAEALLSTVKAMSEVPVVRRWPREPAASGGGQTSDLAMEPGSGANSPAATRPVSRMNPVGTNGTIGRANVDVRVVAVGASTGGPMALKELLSRMPADFPAPILIVQHISDGFEQGFVDWLAGASGYAVRLAAHGMQVWPGFAYVAPAGAQMTLSAAGMVELVDGPHEYGLRPSVARLFRSVDAAFGAAAVGVLLTGMGRDGALELQRMRCSGAVTIAQDRESSVVFGMPAAAIGLNAAMYVLSPDRIAEGLCSLVGLTASLRPLA